LQLDVLGLLGAECLAADPYTALLDFTAQAFHALGLDLVAGFLVDIAQLFKRGQHFS